MKCIYYSAEKCYANPAQPLPELFKPEGTDTEKYCFNAGSEPSATTTSTPLSGFRGCPRFIAVSGK